MPDSFTSSALGSGFGSYASSVAAPPQPVNPYASGSVYNGMFKNETDRYNHIAGLYAERLRQMPAMFQSYGQNQVNQANDYYNQQQASATSRAISSGLYNTTIQDSLQKGISAQRGVDIGNIWNNVGTQLGSMYSGLTGEAAQFLERAGSYGAPQGVQGPVYNQSGGGYVGAPGNPFQNSMIGNGGSMYGGSIGRGGSGYGFGGQGGGGGGIMGGQDMYGMIGQPGYLAPGAYGYANRGHGGFVGLSGYGSSIYDMGSEGEG